MEVGAGCQRARDGLRDFSFSGGVPILGLQYQAKGVPTLPETNIAPKKDGWNTTFLLGFRPMFRGKIAVSFGRVDFYTATQKSHSKWPKINIPEANCPSNATMSFLRCGSSAVGEKKEPRF